MIDQYYDRYFYPLRPMDVAVFAGKLILYSPLLVVAILLIAIDASWQMFWE